MENGSFWLTLKMRHDCGWRGVCESTIRDRHSRCLQRLVSLRRLYFRITEAFHTRCLWFGNKLGKLLLINRILKNALDNESNAWVFALLRAEKNIIRVCSVSERASHRHFLKRKKLEIVYINFRTSKN